MDRTRIEDLLNRILINDFETEAHKVKPSARLLKDLDMAKEDVSDLAITLEDDLDIRIPADDESKWRTVKDVVDYIEGKVK